MERGVHSEYQPNAHRSPIFEYVGPSGAHPTALSRGQMQRLCGEHAEVVAQLFITALTVRQLIEKSPSLEWLLDRKRRALIKHRLEDCGYFAVRNRAADDGLWSINRKRQVIYARFDLTLVQRERAARDLC
jgi:hypothetical protein